MKVIVYGSCALMEPIYLLRCLTRLMGLRITITSACHHIHSINTSIDSQKKNNNYDTALWKQNNIDSSDNFCSMYRGPPFPPSYLGMVHMPEINA